MTMVRRSVTCSSDSQEDSSGNLNFHHEENGRKKNRRHRATVFVLGEKGYIGRIVCPLCLVFQAVLFVALVWNANVKRMPAVGGLQSEGEMIAINHQNQDKNIDSATVQSEGEMIAINHQNQDENIDSATVQSEGEMIAINHQNQDKNIDSATVLQHCTLPTPPRPRKQWTTKPILVPGYPSYFAESRGTANGDIIQPLIHHLTGLEHGSRNFHASIKTRNRVLKRCHTEKAETVTCSQVHPIVDISPEKHQKLFDSHVILALQNFAMALPMGASIKSNRYSDTVDQMKLETWRKTRDLYLQEAFKNWKSVITTWKSYGYYKISMYLPYEHLMDPVKGPLLIQRVAKQLESAGFDTVNLSDLDQAATSATAVQCIWKRSIQDAIKFEEAYIKYKPAYTAKQRDYMLQLMQQFIEEIRTKDNDMELINILKEYHDEIRDVIPIEDDNVSRTA